MRNVILPSGKEMPVMGLGTRRMGEHPDLSGREADVIHHAKDLGFSQAQVRQLVQLASGRESVCGEVRELTEQQINVVDSKLRELSKIREALVRLSKACQDNQDNDCPVLDELILDQIH